jgi:hypothetical protein
MNSTNDMILIAENVNICVKFVCMEKNKWMDLQ